MDVCLHNLPHVVYSLYIANVCELLHLTSNDAGHANVHVDMGVYTTDEVVYKC